MSQRKQMRRSCAVSSARSSKHLGAGAAGSALLFEPSEWFGRILAAVPVVGSVVSIAASSLQRSVERRATNDSTPSVQCSSPSRGPKDEQQLRWALHLDDENLSKQRREVIAPPLICIWREQVLSGACTRACNVLSTLFIERSRCSRLVSNCTCCSHAAAALPPLRVRARVDSFAGALVRGCLRGHAWACGSAQGPAQHTEAPPGAPRIAVVSVDELDIPAAGVATGRLAVWSRSSEKCAELGCSDATCVKVVRDMRTILGNRELAGTPLAKRLLAHLDASFDRSVLEAADRAHGPQQYAPDYRLSVRLHSAASLCGKDADGSSDPYCVLDLVPASKGHAELKHRLSPTLDAMRMSRCVENTLNPVWEDDFVLSLGSPALMRQYTQHKLALVVWDQDDDAKAKAAHSVTAAGRKLQEHFKKKIKGEPDSFLGTASFELDDVPRDGVRTVELELQKRSSRSHVSGCVRLSLSWINAHLPPSALRVQQSAAKDSSLLFGYVELIRGCTRGDVSHHSWWDGGCALDTILLLEEYRFHLGLSALQDHLGQWIILMDKCSNSVDNTGYEYVSHGLRRLIEHLEAATFAERVDVAAALETALRFSVVLALQIVENVFCVLASDYSGVGQMRAACTHLDMVPDASYTINRLLDRAQDTSAFDAASINFRQHEAVEHGLEGRAATLWETACRRAGSGVGHGAIRCTFFANLMTADIEEVAKRYKLRAIDSYRVAVATFDAILCDRVRSMLDAAGKQTNSPAGIDEGVVSVIFDLYFVLQALMCRVLPERLSAAELGRLRISCFRAFFEPFVFEWIRFSEVNGITWSRRAVGNSAPLETSDNNKVACSTAVLDVFRILFASLDVYERLDIGSFAEGPSIMFTAQFAECVCRTIQAYADAEYVVHVYSISVPCPEGCMCLVAATPFTRSLVLRCTVVIKPTEKPRHQGSSAAVADRVPPHP